MKRGGQLIADISETDLYSELEFLGDLAIDLSNIPGACQEQSSYHYQYGKLHRRGQAIIGRMKVQIDIAKDNIAYVKAKISGKVFKVELAKGAKGKPAAWYIDSKVLRSALYRKAVKEFTDLKLELVELEFDVSILELSDKLFSNRTGLLRTMGFMDRSERDADSLHVSEDFRERARELEEGARAVVARSRSKPKRFKKKRRERDARKAKSKKS